MTTSTDFETQVRLVHSHGPDNKNPDYDLGGQPSKFELADGSMNNLFSDVTPDEAEANLVDWRCFYVVNDKQNTVIKDLTVIVENVLSCTSICISTVLQNDMQVITFVGEAETGGYVILATEFGGPFTCEFSGDWTAFATEIETKIRLTRWCENVTVTLLNTFTNGGAEYLVEFDGDVRNRIISPITLVQNNLVSVRGAENRVANYDSGDLFNNSGNSLVKVIWPIPADDLEVPGTIHLFDPDKDGIGGYHQYTYTGFADTYTFNLGIPLTWNLVPGDDVWVEMPSQIKCTVNITKQQDGWPIGQYANFLNTKTDTPENLISCTSILDIGMLLPHDSCFIWTKRATTNADKGCKTCFDINVIGEEEELRPISMTVVSTDVPDPVQIQPVNFDKI